MDYFNMRVGVFVFIRKSEKRKRTQKGKARRQSNFQLHCGISK